MSIVTCNVRIDRSQFVLNAAQLFGGVIYLDRHSLEISNSGFSLNTADESGYGGLLYVMENSVFTIKDSMITNNSAIHGIIHISQSAGYFMGVNLLFGNRGPLSLYYSNITFQDSTNFISSSSNGVSLEGGAITAFQSVILLKGNVKFLFNHAEKGGAILATASKLYILGDTSIANNIAAESGGGMYLYQSELKCMQGSNLQLLTNKAMTKGGGIHAIGSILSIEYLYRNVIKVFSGSRANFTRNTAGIAGGGLYMESNSKLNILMLSEYGCQSSEFVLLFIANAATVGGAIYVADDTYPGVCMSPSYQVLSTASECFCQTLILVNLITFFEHCTVMEFRDNFELNVNYSSNLYGGLLDRCTVTSAGSIKQFNETIFDGLTYFTSIANITDTTSIRSDVSRVCFCKNNLPDCTYQFPPIMTKKGQAFTVPIAAMDHVNHLVHATVLSYLKTNESGVSEGQLIQTVHDKCTDLHFNVFSYKDFEQLILYARGPCKDSRLSQKELQIHFLPCTCPIGFEMVDTEVTRCVCQCDVTISKYIKNCDPFNEELFREGNFWINVINSSNNTQNVNSEYLIYPNCPLNYCHPPHSKIAINFNIPNGADAQCVNGRSGLLCGNCKHGLSLSLGSSRCIRCPSNWQVLLAVIIMGYCLGGILLVIVLLGLNLTVAAGTLNGVIFYANIVYPNLTIFFPFKKRNFVTVFVAWLNLELGFDICLFKGMDAYWKTLLQLLFPLYLILLVILIILISERSSKFARLIGRRNPVATLATLILLSYTKLLNFITSSFSFAILNYPDGSSKTVWIPDATVSFIEGKHIAMLLVAIIVLVVGFTYTFLLLSWQWLLHRQDKRGFCWVKSQTLYMLLEPYHAPYTFKHRYWTGMLLLVRAAVVVISATNATNDPRINCLAVGVIAAGLLLLKGYSQGSRIYKKKSIDFVELVCYVNIALLSLAELFAIGGSGNREVIAYLSGSVTFILLLFVIISHIYIELGIKSFIWKCLKQRRQMRHTDLEEADVLLVEQEVTHSEVSAPIRNELPLTAILEAKNDSTQDNAVSAHDS